VSFFPLGDGKSTNLKPGSLAQRGENRYTATGFFVIAASFIPRRCRKLMTEFSIILFGTLVVLAVGQGVLVVAFVRSLWNYRKDRKQDGEKLKTAIILCLRGRDPFLENCLDSLLDQDHPNYQLRIVVDNREDPAWEAAETLQNRYGEKRVSIETLDTRHDTCSLKCSSVVQAVSRLDGSFQAIALADADTTPHPEWLGDLTSPLMDETIGAATGNRWYMPEVCSWGAMVRYLWNAAAVVQMYWYEVAWGGTLAVKRSAIEKAELLDRWRNAFCEDTMLFRQLGQRGLRVKFVPSLMMVNREDCGLVSCLSWIRRQLLTARLYHSRWLLVFLHGIGTTAVLLLASIMTVVAAFRGDWTSALWFFGGLIAYEAIMFSLLIPMELAVRRIVRSRKEPTGWITLRAAVCLVPAIILTQAVYTLALLGAQFAKKVSWRGVSYSVGGPWKIQRLDDPPYSSEAEENAAGHSL
jgi:cellulose synthase/poly-beta-1,6-N-acetylglucosamine synthase-like glycosyltransferase